MASFDDYLADIKITEEAFNMLREDAKKEYRILYIEWLKLKNSQRAPGTVLLTFDGTSFFT